MPALSRKPAIEVRAPVDGVALLRSWFKGRGWEPFAFQEQAWNAYAQGKSGLINVPTGAGKTYAAYIGPLAELIDDLGRGEVQGLRSLYITPLRAVSRDIEAALKAPIANLKLKLRVESRTGDTSSSLRAKQKKLLPHVLITTPESLSLLLTQDPAIFQNLRSVIIDEWHELLASKRGTQTELALARLRRVSPLLRTWALSATLANLDEAAGAAVGAVGVGGQRPVIIRAPILRPVHIESLIPKKLETLPWAGHLGLRMLDDLLGVLDPDVSTLIFTNTRSQAELWFGAIKYNRPEWAKVIALHHGSIERAERERIERGLKEGSIRLVVCTSSLDLGVDFAPVERVVQIGSPKGIARLLQRAGRSGHRPGAACRILCVPTHALELLEVAAVRSAVERGEIEPRLTEDKPLDVLAQHMVTRALGGGFAPDELYEEVRSAWSYRNLSRDEFDWTLILVRDGGVLKSYPEYRKLMIEDGLHRVSTARIAQLHRLNVGTIVGDATIQLRYTSGRRLGSIEESFVAHLNPGDRFFFAGRTLEFVRVADLDAFVRPARGRTTHTPKWSGMRLPISESLSEEVRRTLAHTAPPFSSPELEAIQPLLGVQSRLSRIPREDQLLIELCETKEGHHAFIFPFEGRLVNAGLAAILALRLARKRPGTYSIAASDYGLEVLSPDSFADLISGDLFTSENLLEDCIASVNTSTLAARRFREVARVAGLVFQSYPGSRKSARQVQTSTSLLFEVFQQFDPENLLLHQARREVLLRHFEQSRLSRMLERIRESEFVVAHTQRPTPFSLPLIIERTAGKLTSQTIAQRIERMKREWLAE